VINNMVCNYDLKSEFTVASNIYFAMCHIGWSNILPSCEHGALKETLR